MGVRRQYWRHFQRSFGKHDSTSHPENWDNPVRYRSLDQTPNTLYDINFEQREPPTEDKVTQINLRDEANRKPIFISESLLPTEKEDLIRLLREYTDVFTWNCEDMTGLDPQVAMHRLNINPDAKPVKQQQWRFRLEIVEAIQSEVKKLINYDFIREE